MGTAIPLHAYASNFQLGGLSLVPPFGARSISYFQPGLGSKRTRHSCNAPHQVPVLLSEPSHHLNYPMNAFKMYSTPRSNYPSTVGVGLMSRSDEEEMKTVEVLQNHQFFLFGSSGGQVQLACKLRLRGYRSVCMSLEIFKTLVGSFPTLGHQAKCSPTLADAYAAAGMVVVSEVV